jgi:branched-chain amino acid aminotransferase
MSVYYVNGEYVDAASASLPVGDLGIVRGYGVFDLGRTYGRTPFRLREHIERLERSAAQIELALPWSADELEAIALETLARNPDMQDAAIRIVVTGGESASYMMPEEKPSLFVMVTPLNLPKQEIFVSGAKLVTVQGDRFLPTVKSINYIGAIMAMKKARRAGAVEALYVSADSSITECTTSNFFAFKGDTLVTPATGVLDGITRAATLEVADDIYTIDYRNLRYDELDEIDEAFITSTTKEILPIVQVDDIVIGDGKPGARSKRLMAVLHELVLHEIGVPA